MSRVKHFRASATALCIQRGSGHVTGVDRLNQPGFDGSVGSVLGCFWAKRSRGAATSEAT